MTLTDRHVCPLVCPTIYPSTHHSTHPSSTHPSIPLSTHIPTRPSIPPSPFLPPPHPLKPFPAPVITRHCPKQRSNQTPQNPVPALMELPFNLSSNERTKLKQ